MNGSEFDLARLGRRAALLLALTALASPAAMAEEAPPPPGDDIHYELSDPVDSPPVNYRSGYDAEYDTQGLHEAEMYAEEYERRQREEERRKREQLDKINDFSSGARTTKGITGGSRY